MHRTDDLDVTALVERHWCRMAGADQAEVEYMAGGRGQHVMRHVVVVQEYQGFARLDFHRVLREHLAFLRNGSLRRQSNGRARDESQDGRDPHRLHLDLLSGYSGCRHLGKTGSDVGSTLLVRVFMNATSSDCSCAESATGVINSERLGRSIPPLT